MRCMSLRREQAILVIGLLLPTVAAQAELSTAETRLRQAVAWQVALEAVGFSPGIIDGLPGPKTRLATREFQRVRGLDITGELDQTTVKALNVDPDRVIGRYTVVPADLDELGKVPTTWKARSELDRLGHPSLDWVIAERFHCARHLLRRLNPGVDINKLKVGDKLNVPIVAQPATPAKAARVEINLTEKVIRVIDAERRLVALFHCSVAAQKSKMPRGRTKVGCVVPDPSYRFDPEKWPEVKERITRPLIIPPGPRNPVGRCWMGLTLSGYGMHGTPNPELIGKTGSHGCIRLANWDAIRLSRMVEVGTPVHFTGHPDVEVASR